MWRDFTSYFVRNVMQVVKVRVEAVDAARKRLTLGLVARKAAGGEDGESAVRDELGGLQPGDVVRGTVEKVQRKQVSCGSCGARIWLTSANRPHQRQSLPLQWR